MKKRRLGRSALVVSEICMGTMTFGSMADEATALAILDKAFDAGVDFFDTAEIYPVPPDARWQGRTEEILGKWLATKPRDAVILATKVTGPSHTWFAAPLRGGKTALDRHQIVRALEGSLKRLKTDYVDLYQVHWPDPDLPPEEPLRALEALITAGKVRVIGVSNETAWGLMKSLWAAERAGLPRYETIQNNFSLNHRRFLDGLAEVCRREQVSLLAYSPLAGGVLTGKYAAGFPPGARFSRYREAGPRQQAMVERFCNERALEAARRYGAIAADLGVEPATLAVAWTLAHDFVASSIVGATHPDQLDASLAAAELVLDEETLARLDAVAAEIPYPMG
ncbi:MAG: aldo/keto reductase [Porticoccaceae bacterium]|nr:MAG: aldo/keto reductase [Porticoccaceae bacterium]